jgi:WD repeat-containing and planar cell polarity effector protein Fritz
MQQNAMLSCSCLQIPYHLVWHPDGTLLMVANEKGQIQCYDLALAAVNFQMLSEMPQNCNFLDLTPYFRLEKFIDFFFA